MSNFSTRGLVSWLNKARRKIEKRKMSCRSRYKVVNKQKQLIRFIFFKKKNYLRQRERHEMLVYHKGVIM